jgi:hypothetical protein
MFTAIDLYMLFLDGDLRVKTPFPKSIGWNEASFKYNHLEKNQ